MPINSQFPGSSGWLLSCLAGLALMGLLSCSNDHILFREIAEIGGEGWSYNDSIRFEFRATDTTTRYDVILEVGHKPDYAWENAYVRILTQFPGDTVRADVVSLELADNYGKWLGTCRGDQCRNEIALQENVRFPKTGLYSLTFVQFMRQETVAGINELCLTVQKSRPVGQ